MAGMNTPRYSIVHATIQGGEYCLTGCVCVCVWTASGAGVQGSLACLYDAYVLM